jgi:hypothetical protein
MSLLDLFEDRMACDVLAVPSLPTTLRLWLKRLFMWDEYQLHQLQEEKERLLVDARPPCLSVLRLICGSVEGLKLTHEYGLLDACALVANAFPLAPASDTCMKAYHEAAAKGVHLPSPTCLRAVVRRLVHFKTEEEKDTDDSLDKLRLVCSVLHMHADEECLEQSRDLCLETLSCIGEALSTLPSILLGLPSPACGKEVLALLTVGITAIRMLKRPIHSKFVTGEAFQRSARPFVAGVLHIRERGSDALIRVTELRCYKATWAVRLWLEEWKPLSDLSRLIHTFRRGVEEKEKESTAFAKRFDVTETIRWGGRKAADERLAFVLTLTEALEKQVRDERAKCNIAADAAKRAAAETVARIRKEEAEGASLRIQAEASCADERKKLEGILEKSSATSDALAQSLAALDEKRTSFKAISRELEACKLSAKDFSRRLSLGEAAAKVAEHAFKENEKRIASLREGHAAQVRRGGYPSLF